MRKIKCTICLLLIISILIPSASVLAEASFYTYNYDIWDKENPSPDAYIPSKILHGNQFGIGDFKEPQGLYVIDNRVFICDSYNNRIVELRKDGDEYTYIQAIDSVIVNEENSPLKYPSDIFVNEIGDMFICDTNNERILHIDKDLEVKNIITQPEDETIDKAAKFYPLKLVVDNANRIYVQAQNVNKGLMEFDSEGDFTGYVGANKVTVNMVDYFWKLISTKEQRSQMELFVPTEYNNIALDTDGFIYTTTSTLSDTDLFNGTSAPVRRLNSMGTDILVRNGYFYPIGDINYGNAGGVSGPSKFVDVVALENDTYYTLDRVRGRIFAYDFQGNLLYAFGGSGNKSGYFQYPSAIEDLGESLLVLDYRSGAITELSITPYGRLINEGLMEYKKGNYDLSSEKWQEVLKYNGNYDLAYIGIGRSLLRKGEYKEAMEYFKLKRDGINYSKAFKQYRKEVVEDNIEYMLLGVALIMITPKIVGGIKKFRKEVKEA